MCVVCRCVKRMLMLVGPRNQTGDDNPGGTLCGPALPEKRRHRAPDRDRRGPRSASPLRSTFSLHFRFALRGSNSHYETGFCEY